MHLPTILSIWLCFSSFGQGSEVGARPARDRGEVIEEVVAVVGSVPILSSDLDLVAIIGLLEPEPGETPSAFRSRLLDARVRLELQYRDLEATGALYRLEPIVNATVEDFLSRHAGDTKLSATLEARGLTTNDVESLGLRIAAVTAYVEQRLRPRLSITAAELEAAYAELVDSLPAAEPAPPLESVEVQLRELLQERRLNLEIERWLAEAADRNEVTRFRP